jgi:CRP-like cAMP-binding protein
MLKLHPQLSINALKLMGARLRLACDSIADMRSQKTENRVARALLRLAHNCGVPVDDGIRLDAPITHQEVANMVGACRQTVTEVLHDFESRGYTAQRGRQIVILDPEALDVYADHEGRSQETRVAVSGQALRVHHG